MYITYTNVALVKKNITPHTQQPTSSVFVARTTHQSPPSYPDLANRRNLVLHVQTPRSSLLRLIIFSLPKCRRMAILSIPQSLQFLRVAVFIKGIVLDFQMMEIPMWDRHQSATSALVLNWRFLTWENKWRASAEQLSCLGSIISGDAWLELGGSSVVESGSDMRLVDSSLALLPLIDSVRSELARCRSCIVKFRPGGGARSSRITHNGG